MNPEIPSTIDIPLYGEIVVHWTYHAWLMFGIWACLVPAIVTVTRFAKPAPTLYGSSSQHEQKLIWFLVHRYGMISCMILSVSAGTLAVAVSSGFSGSLHAWFGVSTVILGLCQVVLAPMRGSRGGMFGKGGKLDDPKTWAGDHYDMTPRRRWFEALHKQVGYFTLFTALGAITTGLAQYWLPELGVALTALMGVTVVAFIVLDGRGLRHETYQSFYGTHPSHPFNRERALASQSEPASQEIQHDGKPPVREAGK